MKNSWSIHARYFAFGLILAVVAIVAWYIREVFTPIIIAGLIAYLLSPIMEFCSTRLQIRRRVVSNVIYFLSLTLLIAIPSILVPVLFDELQTEITNLLRTLDQIETSLTYPRYFAGMTIHVEQLIPALRNSVSSFLTPLPEDALWLLESISKNALWFLVVVVGAYYFMTDWERLREWMIHLVPESYRQDTRRLYLEVKKVWMSYLRGQVTLMIIVGVVFSIIWSIIGLPGALILGILGGLFSLVPDVGPFAATALAFIVALLEGSTWIPWSNLWFAILVIGLYVVLINIKNIWLRPLILGRSVRMHEGLVFIAIMAAVVISGILGAFIIVPVLASVGVIGRYLRCRILGLPPFTAQDQENIQEYPVMKTKLKTEKSKQSVPTGKKRRT